jgi:hypothetical protein
MTHRTKALRASLWQAGNVGWQIGGALQEKSVRLEFSGLAPMYPAFGWSSYLLLAIMDISAHSI